MKSAGNNEVFVPLLKDDDSFEYEEWELDNMQ